MKCLCGYEYEEDWVDGNLVTVKGTDKFIEILVKGHEFQKRADAYWVEYEKVSLHACPKCGTVKMHNYSEEY